MQKDNTAGLVNLIEPIVTQLNSGTAREKQLASVVTQLQHLISTVRGFEAFGDINNDKQFSTYVSNLNRSKLDLIASITKL